MKVAAITFLALLLPAQAWAQTLTLNSEEATTLRVKKGPFRFFAKYGKP
jgi:hypothetical protein